MVLKSSYQEEEKSFYLLKSTFVSFGSVWKFPDIVFVLFLSLFLIIFCLLLVALLLYPLTGHFILLLN